LDEKFAGKDRLRAWAASDVLMRRSAVLQAARSRRTPADDENAHTASLSYGPHKAIGHYFGSQGKEDNAGPVTVSARSVILVSEQAVGRSGNGSKPVESVTQERLKESPRLPQRVPMKFGCHGTARRKVHFQTGMA
jgi:hypothetical protein